MSAFLKLLSLALQPLLFTVTPIWTVVTHLYQVPTLHLSRKSLRAGSPSPPYTRASRSVSCTASCLSSCTGSHWERDHCLYNRESIQSLISGLHHLASLWASEVREHFKYFMKAGQGCTLSWVCVPHINIRHTLCYYSQVLELWQNPLGICPQGCQWLASLPSPIPYLFSFWYLAELLALKLNASLDSQSSLHPSLSALKAAAANPAMTL